MATRQQIRRRPAPRRQRGVATLFIVLMVGLAVTTSVIYSVNSLRSAQERHLTTHSATSAQAAAWRGVEVVRLGLTGMAADPVGSATLEEWAEGRGAFGAAPTPWAESASAGTAAWPGAGAPVLAPGDGVVVGIPGESSIEARLVEITRLAEPNAYRLRARVSGMAGEGSAATRATVEVVFEVGSASAGGAPVPGPPLIGVLNFMDDLELKGAITVKKDEGTIAQVNVDGDVTTGGNSITGVDTIWSTGSVQIGSGSRFGTLRANGDVLFDGSVTVDESVSALGDVCVSGGASGGTILANGSVYANGGVALGDVAALGASERGDRTAMCIPARNVRIGVDVDGRRYAVDLQGNSSARTVRAAQSVRINSGSISQAQGLRAAGHLVDTNSGGSQSGVVGRSVTATNPAVYDWVRVEPGLRVPIAPASPVVLEERSFNAYAVEDQAHYAFKIDPNGFRVVTVRSIAGTADGTYFIADYPSGPYKDHLCTSLTRASTPAQPICAAPLPTVPRPICKGHSDWNPCMSYDAGKREWQLDGQALAPGVAWFEGNLEVGNGTYYATMVATGNISTLGNSRVYALSFAGFDGGVRQEDWNRISYSGICVNDRFPGVYPDDWCDMRERTFQPPGGTALGQYALLAGSYDAEGHYVGGDITLGSSTNIFGSLLAGNGYSSGGNTTIRGSVTALAQGGAFNQGGGSTTLDLRGMPIGFTSMPDPCHLDGSCGGEGGSPGQLATPAQVRWSRYL